MKRIVSLSLCQLLVNCSLPDKTDDFLMDHYAQLGFGNIEKMNSVVLPDADVVEGWNVDREISLVGEKSRKMVENQKLDQKSKPIKTTKKRPKKQKMKKMETIDVKREMGDTTVTKLSKRRGGKNRNNRTNQKNPPNLKRNSKNASNITLNPLIQVRNPNGTLINKLSWLDAFPQKNQKFPKTGGFVKNLRFTDQSTFMLGVEWDHTPIFESYKVV